MPILFPVLAGVALSVAMIVCFYCLMLAIAAGSYLMIVACVFDLCASGWCITFLAQKVSEVQS